METVETVELVIAIIVTIENSSIVLPRWPAENPASTGRDYSIDVYSAEDGYYAVVSALGEVEVINGNSRHERLALVSETAYSGSPVLALNQAVSAIAERIGI